MVIFFIGMFSNFIQNLLFSESLDVLNIQFLSLFITFNSTKKNLISIKKGIINGWKISTLPEHILKFTLNPIIRVFRVIGGISLIATFSQKHLLFPEYMQIYVLYILFFINLIFCIYHLYITFIRFKHIYFLWKSGAYDVRNSPLDRFASFATKLITCVKGSCDAIMPIGTAAGIMAAYDSVLEFNGDEPFFKPIIAKYITTDNPAMIEYRNRRKLYSQLESLQQKNDQLTEEKTLFTNLCSSTKNSLFTQEDIELMKNRFDEEDNLLKTQKDEVIKKINDKFSKK